MTVYRFQAHSIEGQHTEEPTINYSSTSMGVSSHKIVDGKESTTTSGGIVIKGNEFSDWTTWREARNVFKA